MSSSLSDEFEREVHPWLQLAEDLRLLRLDVEASNVMWSYLLHLLYVDALSILPSVNTYRSHFVDHIRIFSYRLYTA